MSLKLDVTIPNNAIYAFIGFVVVFALVAGAYAYVVELGTTPNPGHDLASFQGFFAGDASLEDSLGKLQHGIYADCDIPGNSLRKIERAGSVECEPDDGGPQGPVGPVGPAGAVGPAGPRGAVGPVGPVASSATCVRAGSTYSEGAICNPDPVCMVAGGNRGARCTSTGAWTISGGFPWPCYLWC